MGYPPGTVPGGTWHGTAMGPWPCPACKGVCVLLVPEDRPAEIVALEILKTNDELLALEERLGTGGCDCSTTLMFGGKKDKNGHWIGGCSRGLSVAPQPESA